MQPALFTLCAGNELFYCLLYLFSFSEGPLGRRWGAGLEAGAVLAAQGDSWALSLACIPLPQHCPCSLPTVGSVGLFRMGLWITAPVALLKSLISVVHLITAARNMAALDVADRAKKK